MTATKMVLDRQAVAKIFSFGTTVVGEQWLVTIEKWTAATSTVVLDAKWSVNVGWDLNLTGNLNITGNVNTQTVTNTNVADITLTLNDGGVTPGDDTSWLLIEGTGNTVVGAIKYRAASATKWSIGDGTTQQDLVGATAVQTLSWKTLAAPILTGAASAVSLILSSFLNEAQGANIASATTTDIGGATGNYVNITGSVTITGLGTVQAGARRTVNFNGILVLTYNAVSLILPTAANITTAVWDTAIFHSLGGWNWICTSYQRANGQALVSWTGAYQRSTAVSGTQDSVNKVFTIGNAVSAGSEQVFLNGTFLNPGASNDYIISGTTITLQAGIAAPAATDTIRVYWTY